MLYDAKKWEKKPFSFKHLIPWLEQQPRSKPYDPCSINTCLLGQYSHAHGFKIIGGVGNNAPHLMGTIYGGRRTFGAALRRAQRDHLGRWGYFKLRFHQISHV